MEFVRAVRVANDMEWATMTIHSDKNVEESLSASCEWRCGVEKVWWPIEGKQLNLTDLYAVRWTYSEEAGISDIEMVLRADDEQDAEDLQEWLDEIAANCGSCDGHVRHGE